MSYGLPEYEATANKLVDRIVALGPAILDCESAWGLFKLGLECDDIGPSLAQAQAAWSIAKRRVREANCQPKP